MRKNIPPACCCHTCLKTLSLLIVLSICCTLRSYSQCSAVPGILAGSGSYCDGEQIDIGIPKTKRDQTYTWYQNETNKVKGPVTGNGGGISYEAAMSASAAGHYTVITEKQGCTSAEFGDVTIVYLGTPAGLSITSVYFDSVAFKWRTVAGVLGYEYAVDNDSLPPSSGIFTTDTTATEASLTPFKNYYIHVRVRSFNGGDCLWSTLKFTTVAITGPGSLDKSFDKSGKIITAIGQNAGANAMAIQTDGKIVAAGIATNINGDFTVLRYTANGRPDKTFGNKGKVITDLGGNEQIRGVGLQSSGKIVAAGHTDASASDIALVRYNSDGSLDNTFGSGGKVFTNIFNNYLDQVGALTIQTDDKIVVAGYAINANADLILIRYNSNGSLDVGFGSGGIVVTDFGVDEVGSSIAMQADNKIVVAGISHDGLSSWDFLTVRYKTNGSLDSSFGSNGKVSTDFGDLDDANSVAIQANGKIVVAGSNHDLYSSYSNVAIAKYKPNGMPDSTFDFDGKAYYANESGNIYGRSVALSSNNKIIAAGTAYNGTDNDVVLLRFLSNGQIDPAFGYEGKILTDFGYNNDYANAIRLQPDGKIVIAGSTTNNMGKDKVIVARYNGDNAQTAGLKNENYALSKKIITKPAPKIVISPNPAKETIYISGLSSHGIKNIFISDVAGRVLRKFTTSANSYSCMLSQLSAGIYYACIGDDGRFTYIKFIKE